VRLNAHRVSLLFPRATKAGGPVERKTIESELNLTFKGARSGVALNGEQPLSGRNDYFPTGNPADWKTNIPTFGGCSTGPFTPESIWPLRARGALRVRR